MLPVLLLLALVLAMKGADVLRLVQRLRGVDTPIELWSIGGGFYLRSDAASAFRAMREAAKATGVALVVNSAFRTNAQQEQLYESYVSGVKADVVAPPGFSNHEGGTAIDVETARGTNQAFAWLNANANRFGYYRTVSSEPWHWEFKP